MKDRQPTQPGRVKLTPENGTSPFYAVMEMADEPTEIGTPPTKANLLQDETEFALFGNLADRTVNDAFVGVAAELRTIRLRLNGVATMSVTLRSTQGNALPDVYIQGMFDENGNTCITNSAGVASGYVSEGAVTIGVTGYADIVDYTETFTATAGADYTKVLTVTTRNFLRLTSSKNLKFSSNVTRVDVSVGGGGGSGARTTSSNATGGGGGGYSSVLENVGFEVNVSYSAVVGASGAAVGGSSGRLNGKDGGTSSFLGVSASGGSGGKSSDGGNGNGKGGWCTSSRKKSVNAGNGTTYIYKSFTEQTLYGGGGGGVYYDYGNSDDWWTSAAGSPAGGEGKINADTGGNGTDYLGGGGGATSTVYGSSMSGAGGKGVVAIRMHLKSA